MAYRCRLSNSSTASGRSDLWATVDPSYSYSVGTSIFRARGTFIHTHSLNSYLLIVSFSYFILAVPMRKCYLNTCKVRIIFALLCTLVAL